MYDVQGFAIPGNTMKAATKWFRKTLAECGFSPDTTADEMEILVQKIAENKKEVEAVQDAKTEDEASDSFRNLG